MIAVLDYGIGNLRSAEKALLHVGGNARLVQHPEQARGASGVVLPGVGAFGACAKALAASGLDQVARQAIADQTPFLGICIGFQLLFEDSEESPGIAGLGVVPGSIRRIATAEKLPQMQWNAITVSPGRTSAMFPEPRRRSWFYFVHSFAPQVSEQESRAVVATCDYGIPVIAAIERDRCWGVQFHPEKSGRDGLSLLARFVSLCAE